MFPPFGNSTNFGPSKFELQGFQGRFYEGVVFDTFARGEFAQQIIADIYTAVPVITLVSPPQGSLSPGQAITIDVTDADGDIASFLPTFNDVSAWSLDGSGPSSAFAASSRTPLPGTGNWRYTFRPNLGFREGPLMFQGVATDREGHQATLTLSWTVSGSFVTVPSGGPGAELDPADKADIALVWGYGVADIAITADDVAKDSGLRTAVILSLFTDRRAEPDDDLPAGDGDRRGWWADEFAPVEGDLMGSRLWLLARSAQRPDLPLRVEEFVREGLEWMIGDRVVNSVDVEVASTPGELGFRVVLSRPTGDPVTFHFDHVWDGESQR
jgi:phage gp46-like protein